MFLPQLEALRNELETQIGRQKEELDALKQSLETRIKEVVTNHIRNQLHDMIKESLATVIEEKVRDEVRLSKLAVSLVNQWWEYSFPVKFRIA